MLTVVKLLVLALGITLSLARPKEDVEAVTSLETLLEDSSLEAGDIELDQGKLLRIRIEAKLCINTFISISQNSRWFSAA